MSLLCVGCFLPSIRIMSVQYPPDIAFGVFCCCHHSTITLLYCYCTRITSRAEQVITLTEVRGLVRPTPLNAAAGMNELIYFD